MRWHTPMVILFASLVLYQAYLPCAAKRELLQGNSRVGAGSNAGARWRPEIVIGYPLTFNPFKLAVFKGTFERVTGWTIKWLELHDASKATVALSSGEANMVVANSADIAVALSRNISAKIIWLQQDLDESEGLLVHNRHPEIVTPDLLKGKRIGVWWASTQHYSLVRFLEQMNLPYETLFKYQYGVDKVDKVPKHWDHDPNKVILVPLTRDEMWVAWENGDILGAWVGFPHMYYFKQNGNVMVTNRHLGYWRMNTFDAFLIDNAWAADPPRPPGRSMDVQSFLRTFLTEVAKINYYYKNNTKEFAMTHKVTKGVLLTPVLRVDGELAGVIGSLPKLAWPHISSYKFFTIKEQLSCNMLGCGERSRIAWALRDQALFQKTVTFGAGNARRGLEDGTIGTLQDYGEMIDVSVILSLDKLGVDGSFDLTMGEEVEFGYHDDYAD